MASVTVPGGMSSMWHPLGTAHPVTLSSSDNFDSASFLELCHNVTVAHFSPRSSNVSNAGVQIFYQGEKAQQYKLKKQNKTRIAAWMRAINKVTGEWPYLKDKPQE